MLMYCCESNHSLTTSFDYASLGAIPLISA